MSRLSYIAKQPGLLVQWAIFEDTRASNGTPAIGCQTLCAVPFETDSLCPVQLCCLARKQPLLSSTSASPHRRPLPISKSFSHWQPTFPRPVQLVPEPINTRGSIDKTKRRLNDSQDPPLAVHGERSRQTCLLPATMFVQVFRIAVNIDGGRAGIAVSLSRSVLVPQAKVTFGNF